MTCGLSIGPFPCCSVINGNSRDLFSRVPQDNPVLVITDPPYGINHPCDYGKRGRSNLAKANDYVPVAGDDEKFDPRFLSESGFPVCMWGANYFADLLAPSSGWLVWDKKRGDNLDQATCELAWTNFIKGVRRLVYQWDGFIRPAEAKRIEPLVHPTQKPVALTSWILSLRWTPENVPIVDPFCGSGSALVAAKKNGRHYLGFDLSPEYCTKAEEWLARVVPTEFMSFEKQETSPAPSTAPPQPQLF